MSDLISREEMLKNIEKKRQDALMIDDIRESSIIMWGMNLLEEAVRNQPSAEPEIVRCKDCMHYLGDRCQAIRGLDDLRKKDDYCSFGVKRK